MRWLVLLAAVAIVHSTVYFKETFDDQTRWLQSEKKSDFGAFKLSSGKFYGDKAKDQGLQTSQDAKFYASSAKFDDAVSNEGKSLVVQFSVKHEQDIDCGGGYVKVLQAGFEQKDVDGETPYHIMFGPDICGYTKKIHFILNYKGQNLLWKKEPTCESDTLSHVYTAVLKSDNTYEVYVDQEKKESGKLEDDWEFLKPKTIPDPEDKKPSDWVDDAEMVDPEDKKPDGWDDEPETVADPDATQPEDWDEEEDGEWEAPTITNPKYKGEWKQKMIPNPEYKGVWKAKDIDNPEYEEDDKLYLRDGLAGIAIDLWQVKSGSIFDNIIITDSLEEAQAFYKETNGATIAGEKAAKEKADEEQKKKDEEERKAREAEEKTDAEEDDGDDEGDDDDEKKDEL